MPNRRVVVTGIGAITPIGNTAPEFWNGLISGKSGTRTIEYFDASEFNTTFAAQLEDYDPHDYFDRKTARKVEKFGQYSLIASDEALEDAGVQDGDIDKDRVAVLIGSGIGGMEIYYNQSLSYNERGPRGISPFFIPMLIPDIASGHVSIKYGFRGPNFCAVSACATGSHNIGLAYDFIKNNQADFALAGGAESPINPMGLGGFNSMKAMSTRNEDPAKASRPFDKDRDGFVLGEGSGVFFLEEYEHAKKRGARIYGEIVGYGFSADAHHITAPDPEGGGVILAIENALKAADIQPEEVDHINMHGTSTPLGDAAESNAIKKIFGDHAHDINLNSTKSMTGHTLGAAGAIESIASLLAIYHGIIPPTINYETPDPECDLNYTPNEKVVRDVKYAINNAFGFGGHNTSVVFKKYDD